MISTNSNQRIHGLKRQVSPDVTALAVQLLWSGLKGKQLHGHKCRRQFSIGVFILDFYCQECRLAIEIVGDTRMSDRHEEYTRRRRQYIELYEIAVMRFAASAVCGNIDAVLAKIAEVAKRRTGRIALSPDQFRPFRNTPRDQQLIPLG